jgi:hypothetical protein
MKNLDNCSEEELQAIVDRVENDKHKSAVDLFPSKEPGYVKAAIAYAKYCQARLDLIQDMAKGRDHRASKYSEKMDKIYRTIPEWAQW